jgi:stage V sporulation protein D (sporulation-specific penicillin-binding protein)
MDDRTIKSKALKRSTILGIAVFSVFAILLFRILIIQTFSFSKYQSKVINQITTASSVPASRGKIYDRNGNVLATNITTYRLFISPSSIAAAEEEENKPYSDLIAKGLSSLVENVEYDFVYKQATEYTKYLDRTIQRKVHEEKADEIREFIAKYELEDMVYLEAQSTRYYPADQLAAHILGFTNSDGAGLYGLELQYDKYLSGVDGYYIKARDSYGNEMPFEYSSYIDAIDGYNLTTTIDSTVQSFLEEELAATVEKHNVTNRACGIVMDVNTGAILGMAVSSPFDLNDPWQLDETSQSRLDRLAEEGYDEKSDEYNDLSRELLTTMWSNKAVTESYIPGSTFKIITSSMALEEKVVSLTESVNCPGHKTLFGHTIHCHETKGHGSLSFSQGLQQSCNVWFMTLGERIGVERYQDYVEIFGYRDKTGIDLPGEGNSIFASQMTELDLAIYAFGQNFTVTPIQQITAVASVANGGELLSPYLVEKISDNAGNVIYAHETEQKRETISEDTCKIISQILEEGVSGDGGAKNAYVAGYRVAAKTGTSEKKERECPKCGSTGVPKTVGEDEIVFVCSICKFTADVDDFPVSDKDICSTVAYAPADDPQIAVLIMVDEPTRGSLYGSTVAAPYVRNVLKNSLPYLGVEARYTQEELEKMRIKVANYKNRSVEGAISSITDAGLRYKVIGEGEYVTSQLPEAGTYIEEASGTIVLYASSSPNNTVTVPDLNGMVAATANQALINLNLNVRIEGADSYLSGTGYKVISQSVKAGEKVAPGTVITLTFKKSGS